MRKVNRGGCCKLRIITSESAVDDFRYFQWTMYHVSDKSLHLYLMVQTLIVFFRILLFLEHLFLGTEVIYSRFSAWLGLCLISTLKQMTRPTGSQATEKYGSPSIWIIHISLIAISAYEHFPVTSVQPHSPETRLDFPSTQLLRCRTKSLRSHLLRWKHPRTSWFLTHQRSRQFLICYYASSHWHCASPSHKPGLLPGKLMMMEGVARRSVAQTSPRENCGNTMGELRE